MTDPLDAHAAWHQHHADQARFDGDHGRAQIHQWAAVQAIDFKEEQS